jgi:hypothetical protein
MLEVAPVREQTMIACVSFVAAWLLQFWDLSSKAVAVAALLLLNVSVTRQQ